MPLIDERGRVFGRVNLIDGLVGVVVLLLIPLAYGAYVLFRTLDPTITSIEPAVVTVEETQVLPDGLSLTLSGKNLRPFLKASLGNTQSLGFLIQSPTKGAIKLPKLAPGTYDVVLYDEALEVARMPSAFRVKRRTVNAKIRVRFLVPPGLDNVVKVGDLDVGDALFRAEKRAFLMTLDPERETMSANVGWSGYRLIGQALTAFTATIGVPLVQTAAGWRYRDARVKSGAPFTFETNSYVMEGLIIDAQIPLYREQNSSDPKQVSSDTEGIVR